MLLYYLSLVQTDEEKSKLEKIYNEYREQMKYIALSILKNDDLAEDAVSDAIERVINNLHKIKEEEIYSHKTKSFLVVITRNVSINIINEENKHKYVDIDDINETTVSSIANNNNVEELFDARAICSVIDLLPKRYKEILELKAYRDFTDKEIAKYLDISHNAVRKRLQRARAVLCELLEKEI